MNKLHYKYRYDLWGQPYTEEDLRYAYTLEGCSGYIFILITPEFLAKSRTKDGSIMPKILTALTNKYKTNDYYVWKKSIVYTFKKFPTVLFKNKSNANITKLPNRKNREYCEDLDQIREQLLDDVNTDIAESLKDKKSKAKVTKSKNNNKKVNTVNSKQKKNTREANLVDYYIKKGYPKEWTPELRKRIRNLDGNKCVLCDKTCEEERNDTVMPTLSIHHIDEDKSNLSDSNLITVCSGCHLNKIHCNLSTITEEELWKLMKIRRAEIKDICNF